MNDDLLKEAKKIHDILETKKLESLEVIDVHELTSLADLFIIAVANNIRATKALSDELEFKMEHEAGIFVRQKEGYNTATWILLDYGNIIVHILNKEDEEYYGIERLWQDGTSNIF